jgi:Flp pilus assembly protein TadB
MRIRFNFGKKKVLGEPQPSLQEKFEKRRASRDLQGGSTASKAAEKVRKALEKEAREKVAAEKAERLAAEKVAAEKAERLAAEKVAAEKAAVEKAEATPLVRETTKNVSPKISKKKKFSFATLFARKKQSERGVTPKDVSEKIERSAKELRKKQKKAKAKEKRTAQYRKRMLGTLLVKAGYDAKPEVIQRLIMKITFIIIILFTLVTLGIAAYFGKSALSIITFYAGVWTAMFGFVYLFLLMLLYVTLDLRIYARTRELEEVLPDFLQLTSANISAGMPIDRALWFAVRPNFGVLAKEIESVAKSTLAGEELSDSLMQFTERYDSVMLKRSISILLEGLAAGGELAELLNKIALNIQETKILKKEMSANVTTYAIFITFASVVMAPILFGLATELLTIIVGITSNLDLSASSSSMFAISLKTSPEMITDFRLFSIMMLTVSSLMSAAIVSVIKKGRVREGIRNLPIYIVASLAIYFVSVSILHAMLGSML